MPPARSEPSGAPRARCAWVNPAHERYLRYHDEEWGTPCHDERQLFEMLNLEGAQAGLSWETVLNKREHYDRVFDHWDARRIARYDARKVERLLTDPGIIRNRLKVAAAIQNAQAYLKLVEEVGGLDPYLWGFVDGQPVRHARRPGERSPATTPLSDTISKDLSRRGFKFVGSTIVYAYLQATGVVDDHDAGCFRYRR